jgi:hypothetical protein
MVIKIKPKTVLMVVAGAGMVITTILAARKTPEAQKKKEEALQKKREETGDENAQLTFVESMQAQVGSYVPAIVTGLTALGALAGSEVLNEKNLKKATKALDDFKDMTEKIDGKGAVKTVEKAIEQKKIDEKNHKPWDKPETFRIVFQGHSIQFEKTRAEVIEALYETNRYFHGRGIVTFNEFLEFLGQSPVEEGDNRGWESYIGDAVYGYTWIDFGLKECEDEWWVTEIYMPVYPHFFEQEMCEAEIEEGCKKLGLGNTGAAPEDG